jgi:hypothetical protein
MCDYFVKPSAYKHGIKREDMYYVIDHSTDRIQLEEDPTKFLYWGYDSSLRDLEVVTTELIDGVEVIIHAMKIRESTLKIIEEERNERRR